MERQQTAEGFWDDMEASSKVLQKTKQLKNKVERFEALCSEREDLAVLIDMMEEEPDASMEAEIQTTFEQLKEKLEQMKLDTLLSGPYDKNNAIIALHAGAGEQKHRTGRKCLCVCICAGRSGMGLVQKC